VAQKTSLEALALSARNTELAKRNQHHHRLGPSGYYVKEEQFRRIEKEATTSGSFNLSRLKVRSRNWIIGRSSSTDASRALKFSNPKTKQVVSKILKYAEDKDKGLFKPSRERDKLSLVMENPKHTGCIRG
jgi:hypothetical protein